MARRSSIVTTAGITLDRSLAAPLHRQLYDALRDAILSRRFKAEVRLPSTRSLARELGVSRNTAMVAFDQLLAEGYLEGKTGSGTYVARALPDDLLRARAQKSKAAGPQRGRRLSERGRLIASTRPSVMRDESRTRAFQPGVPDIESFPFTMWARMIGRRWRKPQPRLLGYGHPAGYEPLRQSIADYLSTARAASCDPSQVIIVSGAQQAIDLAARALLDPADAVWIEDPCYQGARGVFAGALARIIPVPVDDEGLSVAAGRRFCPDARLAYVTPSHQYPLGMMMSLARRLELLAWAREAGAWIVEDDYDSEYRYAGRPLASLQGLDTEGRVIYIGTFSRVLFPSLRLGYMVVPLDMVEAFTSARAFAAYHSPLVEQDVLAEFIAEGHFARHIRRMRALYQERQQILIESVSQELAGLLEVKPSEAGMHLIGWLQDGIDDKAASRIAADHRIDAPPLSFYCMDEKLPGGLLLGYTGINEREIRAGARRLADALREASKAKISD
ncbi:MAG TPA: PLP-dependent aminotransferase family protein, partial [Blastocatellia bacterium]